MMKRSRPSPSLFSFFPLSVPPSTVPVVHRVPVLSFLLPSPLPLRGGIRLRRVSLIPPFPPFISSSSGLEMMVVHLLPPFFKALLEVENRAFPLLYPITSSTGPELSPPFFFGARERGRVAPFSPLSSFSSLLLGRELR